MALVQLEEFDEENDAKLFWDVVNSMHDWQKHKDRQEELKQLGGLTRFVFKHFCVFLDNFIYKI